MTDVHVYVRDIRELAKVPENGILSQTLQNDDRTKVILFGFAAGQELVVPHFRPPGFELHGMNPLSSAVIVDQVTRPRYLHEEGFPLDDLSLAVADLIDEVNVADRKGTRLNSSH